MIISIKPMVALTAIAFTAPPVVAKNEKKPLSAPATFAVAFAFAFVGLVGYSFAIMHPGAQQLLSWAQAPI